jgi:FkbM family methyltransferase
MGIGQKVRDSFLSSATRRARYSIVSSIAAALCPRFLSYSVYGEDKLVMGYLYARMDLRAVRYLDIGAGDPVIGSNTYALYQLGASGVLVEPTPDKARMLRRTRRRDIVVQAGAAFKEDRSAELILFGSGNAALFNTFDQARADEITSRSAGWRDKLEVQGRVQVPLVSINDLVATHFAGELHFLSIDVEGYDFEVLKRLDLARYGPLAICVEASSGNFDALLSPHGYQRICMTPDNFIFLKP